MNPSRIVRLGWRGKAALAALLLLIPLASANFAVAAPILRAPKGAISDNTPTFKWDKVNKATKYQVELRDTKERIFAKQVPSCATSPCSYTHPTVELLDGSYRWRVRVLVNNAWSPWSAFMTFQLNTRNFVQVLNTSNNQPISNAAVRVLGAPLAQPVAGWTNTAGEFIFTKTSSGTLTIEVQALGYVTREVVKTVGAGPAQVVVALNNGPLPPSAFCQPESLYPVARYVKMHIYDALSADPQILIFGSSRAFTMSPKTMQAAAGGAPAYNAAIGSGSILDAYYFAKFFFGDARGAHIKVMVVEIQLPALNRGELSSITPIEIWPLIPDRSTFNPKIDLCGAAFNMATNQNYVKTKTLGWAYDNNNGGMGVHKPINQDDYNSTVAGQRADALAAVQCSNLSPTGTEHVELLIELAEANGVNLVFYRPPYNLDLYSYIKDDPQYQNCSNLINTYLGDLDAAHASVYFQDLSAYRLVNNRYNGFWDAHHYKENASNEIINLLKVDIRNALP